MHYKQFGLLLLLWLMTPLPVTPQMRIEARLNENRSLLESLERQIEHLRKQIAQTREKESSLAQQIGLINEQLALTIRSKGLLEQEVSLLERKIANAERQLKDTREQLQDLKDIYTQRAIYTYKYGKRPLLELLLTANSLNQVLVRMKYLRLIAEHDENLIRLIRTKRDQIEKLKEKLELGLQEKSEARNDLDRKIRNYASLKLKKRELLKKLKRSHQEYETQLAQRQKERQRLLDLIASLEKSRKSGKEELPPQVPEDFSFADFSQARGKLYWPIEGKIISRYGKQRDPQSKTYVNNTDIEISARIGSPVRSVFRGIVRVITYLPGYGNTVIIDHGKGYYTVYSHLGEIYVHKNQAVETRQIIGKIDDSGYLGPVSLKFGIYGENTSYNPEKWLQ